MAESRYRIHLAKGTLPRAAAPLEVDENLRIVSGVGPDDIGARLIGFATPGTEQLAVSAVKGVVEVETTVGLEPVLGKRGTFFSWGLAVELIEVIEPEPEPEAETPTPAPEAQPESEVDEDEAFIAGELNG